MNVAIFTDNDFGKVNGVTTALRAVLDHAPRLEGSAESIALVPVGAILVSSIHFTFIDVALNMKYTGSNRIPCRALFAKGAELGHFRHGSTIVVCATGGLEPSDNVRCGETIRMVEPLLRHRSPTVAGRCLNVATKS